MHTISMVLDSHVLHKLLPDRTTHCYQQTQRPHDRTLVASDDTRNFIHRLLHRNVYWSWSSLIEHSI